MEGGCEYTEYAVVDSQLGVLIELRDLARGYQLLTVKTNLLTKCYTGPRIWTDSLERPGQRKIDMRFKTCNVRSLYRAGSLKTVASELSKYNLDLVAVQEVRWVYSGTLSAYDYTFCYVNGNANHYLGTGFFIHQVIISAVMREEFISDRMLYITLTDR
jgi:hypothetical protein